MREKVIKAIEKEKIIAIVRGVEKDKLIPLARALYNGGIKLIEITYSADKSVSDGETAENIKIEIGSAFPSEKEESLEIKGRNLLNGLPENIIVNSAEIRDALVEPLSRVIDAIKSTLEETPPELSADIIDHGITLAGGGALLRGLDKLINRETGMPVYIAEYPLDCVAEGTGKILENINDYQDALTENVKYY